MLSAFKRNIHTQTDWLTLSNAFKMVSFHKMFTIEIQFSIDKSWSINIRRIWFVKCLLRVFFLLLIFRHGCGCMLNEFNRWITMTLCWMCPKHLNRCENIRPKFKKKKKNLSSNSLTSHLRWFSRIDPKLFSFV